MHGLLIGGVILLIVFYLYSSKFKGELKKNSLRDKINQQEIDKEVNKLAQKLEENEHE